MAAYRHLGNGIYVGLTTDTKPTPANTANGAICIEWATNYATFTLYVNNQTAWLAQTAFSEAYTNKTLTSPTITTPTMSAPLTVANGGTGAGTLTGILKGNGTSAVTASALLAVADGGTGIGTLTGLVKGNGTSAMSAVTAPSGTVVGSTDTIELTNKTIDPALNTMPSHAMHPGIKKTGAWMGTGAPNTTSCWGFFDTSFSTISTGTAAFTGIQRKNISGINGGTAYRMSTGGTGASLVGYKGSLAGAPLMRAYNPRFDIKLNLGQATTNRCAFGFHGATANPTAGTEPAANLNSVLFWYDSGVDGQWHIAQNNGAATSDLTTIATVAAADTDAHVFSLRADNTNSKFQYYYGAATNGPPTTASTWVDINTKIPAATSAFNYAFWMENIGSNTCTFDVYWAYMEVDC